MRVEPNPLLTNRPGFTIFLLEIFNFFKKTHLILRDNMI